MRDFTYFDVYFCDKKDGGYNHKILKGQRKKEIVDYMENLGYTEADLEIFSRQD